VTHIARPPKTQDAQLVELSANCRAVVYGRTGGTLLFRGDAVFALNDLEAAKLDAARADYLRKVTVPK